LKQIGLKVELSLPNSQLMADLKVILQSYLKFNFNWCHFNERNCHLIRQRPKREGCFLKFGIFKMVQMWQSKRNRLMGIQYTILAGVILLNKLPTIKTFEIYLVKFI
jgi:hypothetical protein